MAKSGSKSVTVTSWDTLKFSWSEASQDIANNKTKINWKMELIAGSSGRISSTASKDWSVTVNGKKYSGTNTVGIANNDTKTLASGSTTITHNSDGTKSFSYSFSQEFSITFSGSSIGTKSGSGTGTLDTIPRTSTLSVANGTLGTAQTLTVTRQSTAFKHRITATCGGTKLYIKADGTTSTSVVEHTDCSISFTPPLSWASANTTGTTVSVEWGIGTYTSDGTRIGGNTYTKTYTIPSSVKPSCKITVSESTSYGAYVKGLSKAKIVVTPTKAYGSDIASYSVSANGATYTTATSTTGALSTAGTMTITATVKDKRGRTGTASTTITVVDKSTLTVANGTLGTAQTVSLTKGHSTFKHQITYLCGSYSGYVAGSASTFTTGTSASWTPPLSMANENTTGTSVSVNVYLLTYTSNGTKVGEVKKTITCSIPSSVKPSCSVSVTDSLGYADTYGGFLKGLSKFKVVVTPTLAYSSAIASYSTTANGATYTSASFTTGALNSSGTLTVNSTVKDKRGRSGSASVNLTVLDYTAPTISKLTVGRCNSDGTANEKGDHVKVIFSGSVKNLNNKNSASYVLKYKKTTESSYTTKTFTEYANTYSVSNATFIFAADTGASYNVSLSIKDDLKTTTESTTASTAFTLMHFSAGGTGMGIGKIAEAENLLDIGVPVSFREGFVDNILWTGAWYMNASQTISLSQSVQKQRSGIALVFSAYEDGEAKDYHFATFFVPKYVVANKEGLGHTFSLIVGNFAYIGTKYLYISNDKIVGNDTNVATGTNNGVTYANNHWVLRYVIGV